MKKLISLLTVAILCFCLLVGCSQNGENKSEKITVYSFCGENEQFAVTNGVIVISAEQAAAGKNTLEQKSTDGLSENGGDDQSGDPASPAGSSANPIPEAYPAAQSNGEETVTGKEE